MQSIITLKKIWSKASGISLAIFLLLCFSLSDVNAQTTLTTTFTNNNGFSLVTFNFTNNNPSGVIITGIASVCGTSGSMPVAAYVKTSAINGSPGAISAANGWNQFASATITAVANTTTSTPQTFFSGLSLIIPAGATYGIAVQATDLRYSTLAAGTYTIPGGGCVLTTGTNIGYAGAAAPAVPGNSPRGFIGSVTFTGAVPCSGTPTPGATNSTATTSCTGTPFTLSPANSTAGSGVTYQYFQSATGVAGSYTPIAGATSSSYTTAVSNMYYYVAVTCGGNTGTSTPVFVATTPASGCYCASNATTTADEEIFNVTVGSLNNSSTCTTLAPGPGSLQSKYSNYTNYPGAPAAPDVIQGANNPFSVQVGTCGTFNYSNSIAVFIDLNQDGDFIDAGEKVFASPVTTPGAHFEIGNLVIPATATLGNTRMRVISSETSSNFITPCGTYGYGETEDYIVNIVPCVPVAITSQPADASASCGNTATFTVGVTGSVPTYQWQYRVNATSPWITVLNVPPYSGANTATLTISPVATSMSGYQYRAIVTGGCSGADFSSAATLTVTPLALAIAPTTITKCLAAAPVLISAPNTQTVLNFTNSTPGFIADGDLVGITRTVTVSGVTGPVQKVRVKINATGNYIGDMVASLKAPNGQIINIDYLLNRTNNGPSTGSGFVNTIFNLNRTVRGYAPYNVPAAQAIDQFNAPYTGEFPIDNQQAMFYVGVPSGPTGFAANTSDPTSLYPTAASANGVWTLGMYDAGPPDPINFQNYTLEITFGGAPATIAFTGNVAGLFTDAAGLIPYVAGTQVSQVYAAPTANATYQAVTTAGPCSNMAQTITVNVNTPAAGTPTLSNTSVCAGNSTFLKLGGTLTGGPGFVHTFQVKAPGAVNFTNITASGIYSFLGDSLRLTGVPQSFNGYQFRDSISTGSNCGSVISTVATLTVNPIPVVTISAAPRVNLFPGLTTTLTAAVSSATPPVTYQWFRNGVAVPGATNNTLVVGIDQLGTYTVRATAQGCTSADSTTTPKTIVIGDSVGVTTLFIYPSPNTGKFQVRYFNDVNTFAPSGVNVYDEKGARVFTRSYVAGPRGYTQFNVDLGAHGRGIYRVELVNSNGDRIKTGSVMVF